MIPRNPERPLAAHVQAAIAAGQGTAQPKTAEAVGGGRPVAAHVRAAVSAGRGVGQAKLGGTVFLTSVQQAVKKESKKHHTKKGNIKQSTRDWLMSDKVDIDGLVKLWEDVHGIFNELAGEDPDGCPPGAAPPPNGLPLRLNLSGLGKVGHLLSVGTGGGLGNRGAHDNAESQLPVYPAPQPYTEHSAVGGGIRLVVDTASNREYVSLHYSVFYRIR